MSYLVSSRYLFTCSPPPITLKCDGEEWKASRERGTMSRFSRRRNLLSIFSFAESEFHLEVDIPKKTLIAKKSPVTVPIYARAHGLVKSLYKMNRARITVINHKLLGPLVPFTASEPRNNLADLQILRFMNAMVRHLRVSRVQLQTSSMLTFSLNVIIQIAPGARRGGRCACGHIPKRCPLNYLC